MNNDRKNRLQQRKSWRDFGPGKGDKPDRFEGETPIFKKMVKGREFEWCEKCNHGQGKWTTTHNTANHRKDFNKEDSKRKSTKGEANIVDSTYGLQPMFLIAECQGLPARTAAQRKHGGNRRQSTKRFGRQLAHTRPYQHSHPRPVSPSPPPSPLPYNPKPDWDNHGNKRSITGVVIGIGILLLVKSLGIDWEACYESASNHWWMLWNYLQKVKYVELLYKWAELSCLTLVPMLWSAVICMTLKGKDIMRLWYPQDNWQELEQESRIIRRRNEQWYNREYSRMKRQLTKEFEKRSQVMFTYQDKRFNKMMQHIRVKNRLAELRQLNRNRKRIRREYPTSELWFKQRMKDYRGKSRVDFKREWSSRHNAMQKVHRQRELSELNKRYRVNCSDNPWVGKTLTEIQKQYREHDKSAQDLSLIHI